MRRRYFSSKYSRQRGKFCLSDDAPTLEELAAERKRNAEEKAKAAAQQEPAAQQLLGQAPCAG